MNKVVGKFHLYQFLEKLPDSKRYIQVWYEIVRDKNLEEIIRYFGPEVIVSSNSNELIFNLKIKTTYTHRYCLAVNFNEKRKLMFIQFIGTQNEYQSFNEESRLKLITFFQKFLQRIKVSEKKAIKTETHYLEAIRNLRVKMIVNDDTLALSVQLIEEYEKTHYFILPPDKLDSFKIKTKLI